MTRVQNCPRILKSNFSFFKVFQSFAIAQSFPTHVHCHKWEEKLKRHFFDDLSKSPASMLVIKVQIHNLFGTWHSFIVIVQFFPFVFLFLLAIFLRIQSSVPRDTWSRGNNISLRSATTNCYQHPHRVIVPKINAITDNMSALNTKSMNITTSQKRKKKSTNKEK